MYEQNVKIFLKKTGDQYGYSELLATVTTPEEEYKMSFSFYYRAM